MLDRIDVQLEVAPVKGRELASLRLVAPQLAPTGLTRLKDAVDALGLSARGYHRVWRLARTLADLDGGEAIDDQRLKEAMSFRALEREKRIGA